MTVGQSSPPRRTPPAAAGRSGLGGTWTSRAGVDARPTHAPAYLMLMLWKATA